MNIGSEFSWPPPRRAGELSHGIASPQVTPDNEFSWFQENSAGAQEDQGRQFSCLVPFPRGAGIRRTQTP